MYLYCSMITKFNDFYGRLRQEIRKRLDHFVSIGTGPDLTSNSVDRPIKPEQDF